MIDQLSIAKPIRLGQLFIFICFASFVPLERLFEHLIPKEYHPAATIAMLTAVLWCIATLIVASQTVADPPTDVTVGMTTGCFSLSTAGLLIGIGESGCSAWMLTAPLITGSLGLLWWWAVDENFNLSQITGCPYHTLVAIRQVRMSLARSAIVAFFLLAPVAVYLKW